MPTKHKPFIIENIQPTVNGGKYPLKREVGDTLTVTATVFRDGHDISVVSLKYREKFSNAPWQTVEMKSMNSGLDLWQGNFPLEKNCRYQYTIEGFTDVYKSWLSNSIKKYDAGQDITSELLEGQNLLVNTLSSIEDKDYLEPILNQIKSADNQQQKFELFLAPELATFMRAHAPHDDVTAYEPFLEVVVDRVRARYAAWYEFFPRSQGTIPGQSATFADCKARLPEIKAMGFDVVYLPPIHPIGSTNRKGKNNSVTCEPGEPGSPYAIGSHEGGHMAIEPQLGTFDDFADFEQACRQLDMEIALDFAINCSPDHPYVKEHPEWFFKRPDGTIKYAENPPKTYEDIYPLNFYAPNGAWKELWEEMKNVLLFWIERGVRIFRVDNPHTKPMPFWEWLINDLQQQYPDLIFLSEAFTRPPVLKMLAKVGFTQSYTYFTWRNFKHELTEYLTELTQSEAKEYLRGNFFANTPDILPYILQEAGRPAFITRFALAATLSSVYGIYSGFELCESEAVPNKEEYFNSEKYEIKIRDWNCPGNIKELITKVNQIRRDNPALHYYKNLRFYRADNDNVLFYGKTSPDKKNVILVAVNLDPYHYQETGIYIPIWEFDIEHHETYQLHNLITGERMFCQGEHVFIRLDPHTAPVHIYELTKWLYREHDFDYFGM